MPDPAAGAVRTVAAVLAAPAAGPAGATLFAPLAGRPVIEHSVAAFEASPLVRRDPGGDTAAAGRADRAAARRRGLPQGGPGDRGRRDLGRVRLAGDQDPGRGRLQPAPARRGPAADRPAGHRGLHRGAGNLPGSLRRGPRLGHHGAGRRGSHYRTAATRPAATPGRPRRDSGWRSSAAVTNSRGPTRTSWPPITAASCSSTCRKSRSGWCRAASGASRSLARPISRSRRL